MNGQLAKTFAALSHAQGAAATLARAAELTANDPRLTSIPFDLASARESLEHALLAIDRAEAAMKGGE